MYWSTLSFVEALHSPDTPEKSDDVRKFLFDPLGDSIHVMEKAAGPAAVFIVQLLTMRAIAETSTVIRPNGGYRDVGMVSEYPRSLFNAQR